MVADVSPKISVIMSVYNSAAFVKEAIDSVLQQTYSDFEFIIINDGSTDTSEDLILAVTDKRIRYVRNEGNKGLIYSLNHGVSIAKGRYIARMDADDICDVSRFQKQIHEFEKSPELIVCGSFIKTFGAEENYIDYMPVSHGDILSSIFFTCPFAHPSVMMRKEALAKLNSVYREEYKHSEDYDLWSRLVFTGTCKNIPEFLLNYRVHTAQVSTVHEAVKYRNVTKIQSNIASEFNLTLNPSESSILLNLFKGISRKDRTYLNETRLLIEKLYAYFSKKYPEYSQINARIMVARWLKICGNSGLGFYNVKSAFNLSFISLKYIKFKDLLKLFYKTLTNYQQIERQDG